MLRNPWLFREETVDLIYLDPPFKPTEKYNVLFRAKNGTPAAAQVRAFEDTWHWDEVAKAMYHDTMENAPTKVRRTIDALKDVLDQSDMFAYLCMMAPRLVEMHKVLTPTGSLYLHCDPGASHYLKLLMDAVFGAENFRNEIIWRRTGSHTSPRSFETIHDVIFFYSKTDEYQFTPFKRPYSKEHVESRYVKDQAGRYKFTTGGNILTGPGATKGDSGEPWRGFDPTAKNRHWAIPGYLAAQMPPEFANLSVTKKLEALYQAGLIEIKRGATWPHPIKYLVQEDGLFVPDIWAYQPGTGLRQTLCPRIAPEIRQHLTLL